MTGLHVLCWEYLIVIGIVYMEKAKKQKTQKRENRKHHLSIDMTGVWRSVAIFLIVDREEYEH